MKKRPLIYVYDLPAELSTQLLQVEAYLLEVVALSATLECLSRPLYSSGSSVYSTFVVNYEYYALLKYLTARSMTLHCEMLRFF